MFFFGSMIAEMQAAKAQKAIEMFNRRRRYEAAIRAHNLLYASRVCNYREADLTPTNIPHVRKTPNKGL